MKIWRGKKGQFFIAALVILSFSLFLIFSYIQTTSSEEVRAFQRTSSQDLVNVLNVIEEQNEKNAIDWYDANWPYRKKYTGGGQSCTAGAQWDPKTFNFDPNGHNVSTNCSKELVAAIQSAPTTSIRLNVSSNSAACTTVNVNCSDAQSAFFYVYYGNPDAVENNKPETGTAQSPAVFEEQAWVNCTQIESNYRTVGYSANCNATKKSGQTATYSLGFYSQNLKFYGNVS